MKGIFFDTSASLGYVTISYNDNCIAYNQITKEQNFSFNLVQAVQNILACNNLSLSNLHFIAVGIGPGSFTGMRIAATVAISLSYALSLPLITYHSLIGYIPKDNGSFITILDAHMGGFYCIEGIKENTKITYTSNSQKLLFSDFTKNISKDCTICTPDILSIKQKLSEYSKLTYSEVDTSFLSAYLHDKYLKKEFTPLSNLELYYLKNLTIDQ